MDRCESDLQALNGQNIFPGCCTMKIDFSKLQTLNIRFNNDKSRDYTESGLNNPPGPLGQFASLSTFLGADVESLAALAAASSAQPPPLQSPLAVADPTTAAFLSSLNPTFGPLSATAGALRISYCTLIYCSIDALLKS